MKSRNRCERKRASQTLTESKMTTPDPIPPTSHSMKAGKEESK